MLKYIIPLLFIVSCEDSNSLKSVNKPLLELSSSTISFPSIEKGKSESRILILRNSGGGVLTLKSFRNEGDNIFDYDFNNENLLYNNLPIKIRSQDSARIIISYYGETQNKRTKLYFETNDPSNKEASVDIIVSNSTADIVVTPYEINFDISLDSI